VQSTHHTKNLILVFITTLLFVSHCFCDDIKSLEKKIQLIQTKVPLMSKLSSQDRDELAHLYLQLGELLEKTDPKSAVMAFRKSLSFKPSQPSLQFQIGECYFNMQEYEKALPFIRGYCQSEADAATGELCSRYLESIYDYQGDKLQSISLWDKAIESYKMARSISRNHLLKKKMAEKIRDCTFQSAVYHYSRKHFLEAAHLFLDALSEQSSAKLQNRIEKIATHLFINAGKHYEKTEEPSKAIPFYKAVLLHFSKESARDYAKKRLEVMGKESSASKEAPSWLIMDEN
jgi:tetratricopeptide (TPR) repeat protein